MPDLRRKDKTTTQKGGTTKTVKSGENRVKTKSKTVSKGPNGGYTVTSVRTKRKAGDDSSSKTTKTKTKSITAKKAKRVVARGTKKAIKSKAKSDIAMSKYKASNSSEPKLKRGGGLNQFN